MQNRYVTDDTSFEVFVLLTHPTHPSHIRGSPYFFDR